MRIGEAAAASGLRRKTIRFYEDIGLVHAARKGNGYREFDPTECAKLRFLAAARSLGFPLKECRNLLTAIGSNVNARQSLQAWMNAIGAKQNALEDYRALIVDLIDGIPHSSCSGDVRALREKRKEQAH